MAWIQIVGRDEATGRLAEVYERASRPYADGSGGAEPSEVVKVFSLRPDLMEARIAFGDVMTFGGSGLGRYREELIAVSISQLVACRH